MRKDRVMMMQRFGIGALLALGFLVSTAPAGAQRCEAPRLMLSVDRSSSMLGRLPEGLTKWQATVRAVESIATRYEGRIEFGVQPFPYPNRCGAGRVELPCGLHPAGDVVSALGPTPPTSGNWTPLTQTLEAALDDPALRDASRARYLVLLTDGWQWCDPYDPATRFSPVEAVRRLRAAGVTVYVVGFGAAVDSLTLNRAAVAAGTALPGCDATLSDPAAPNHCYMQANTLVELSEALGAVAREITEEVCDGVDNDCDGTVDEGFDADGDGVRSCDGDCDDTRASVHRGASEACNGVDDDCDGTVDPGCACNEGDERSCGTDLGACSLGVERCVGGTWGRCEGAHYGSREVCNGIDDDCDGAIDDGADSSCGADEVCTPDGCLRLVPDAPETPPATDEPESDPSDDGSTRPERGPPSEAPGCVCSVPGRPAQHSAFGWLGWMTAIVLVAGVVRRRR